MMQRVVLVGAGHAHALVLKGWSQAPVPGVELVVVSPQALAPYSGMVPGWLAGAYRFEDIVIDMPRLCQQAGARWMAAALSRLAPHEQCIELSNGDRLRYDLLSLNVGSTTPPPPSALVAQVLAMRPLAELRAGYEALLTQWREDQSERPFSVMAVGGGAAGFESLLAVLKRLRTLRPRRPVLGTLVTRGDTILSGYAAGVQRAAMQALRDADVTVRLGVSGSAGLGAGADLILWATGAQPHDWQRDAQRRGDLAVDADGFVWVDPYLRSLSHPNIFAVGDCAQWKTPLPKAGVVAVRMGPVLLHNLRASLVGDVLQPYRPRRAYLSLLATADGRAIATRAGLHLSGRWAWRLKDRIDRGFVRRFSPAAPRSVGLNGETL